NELQRSGKLYRQAPAVRKKTFPGPYESIFIVSGYAPAREKDHPCGRDQRERKRVQISAGASDRRGEEDGTVNFPSSCYDPGADPYRRRNDIRRTICPDI